MFLRITGGILHLILYALVFWLGFLFVGLFFFIVLQMTWTALIAGVLAGLLAVWFVRGLLGNIDQALEPVANRIVGNPPQNPGSLPDTNPHDRLPRLSELRDEGHLSAEEYESKRQEIMREL